MGFSLESKIKWKEEFKGWRSERRPAGCRTGACSALPAAALPSSCSRRVWGVLCFGVPWLWSWGVRGGSRAAPSPGSRPAPEDASLCGASPNLPVTTGQQAGLVPLGAYVGMKEILFFVCGPITNVWV